MTDAPQIYLITPRRIALQDFPDTLARVMDAHEVACVRLALDATDADDVARAADAIRPVCHARDVALVIEDHYRLVGALGLDGVHLTTPQRLRDVKKEIGKDAIAGVHCGASRHDGMTAGEIGAAYVSFGPVVESPLGTDEVADAALFQWWTEMIEVPVVAEGGLTPDVVATLSPMVDFLGIGDEIWSGDPAETLKTLLTAG